MAAAANPQVPLFEDVKSLFIQVFLDVKIGDARGKAFSFISSKIVRQSFKFRAIKKILYFKI